MPPTRRSIVRAGVATAWTAPLVMIAVPAHAAACSGGVVQLTAQEVAGSKVVTFFEDVGALVVEVTTTTHSSGSRSADRASA